MNQAGVWIIATLTVLAILIRPKRWPEAVWACLGAGLLVLFRYLSPEQALAAVERGTDVYLFLAGMMLLAELARRQGLFDWLAFHAVRAAKGSRVRLLVLIYTVGIAVTALLSNDATAVVLTPAVYTAVKKARAAVLPYLFICAFIANAASFVLPISNPANLVIFGKKIPPLIEWLRSFTLPSMAAIAATYVGLRVLTRRELKGEMELDTEYPILSVSGLLVAWGIVATTVVLLTASALGKDLGLPTFVAAVALLTLVLSTRRDTLIPVMKHISWGVLPLVAGLFIIVGGLEAIGAVDEVRNLLHYFEDSTRLIGAFASGFGVAALCNIGNNLPMGLLAGSAVQGNHIAPLLRNALVIGVDLGPNLSVTGSLATILWLIALRREGVDVSAWRFLKFGIVLMPLALFPALCALLISS
jgi:arsenical pump membrane protein